MEIYDVFISYRRSDGEMLANQIHDYLKERGLRVFLDKQSMKDGHYFTDQIERNLRGAPNYILVATKDVFDFREGEDWVRNEIEIALEAYEANREERTVTVLTQLEDGKDIVPEKMDLPETVRNITDVQRIVCGQEDWMEKSCGL